MANRVPGVAGESVRSDLVHLGLVVVPPPWIGQQGCVSSAMLALRQMSWLKVGIYRFLSILCFLFVMYDELLSPVGLI